LYRADAITLDAPDVDQQFLRYVEEFTGHVNTSDFPCIYAKLPFGSGDLYFGRLRQSSRLERDTVAAFRQLCRVIHEVPDAVTVLFVEQTGTTSLPGDLALARRMVQAVMRADAADHPGLPAVEPDSTEWTLRLDGISLFVNFSSPNHVRRRSRNVASVLTVIAQARETFDQAGRASAQARDVIRRRIAAYDSVAPHPALARYGDPGARESHQYFLGDGMIPLDVTDVAGGDRDD
jgi:FPC/CPF motif-containing protein YcgG